MVTVAVAGAPKLAPPVTLLSVTPNVSLPSAIASLMIGIAKVFDVSPGAKVRVSTLVAKSHRPKALPPDGWLQPTVKLSVSVVM